MATASKFPDAAPWPTKPENERAVIGGNNPPLEARIPLEFKETLLSERPDFLQLLDNYLGVGDPNAEDFKEGSVHRAKCNDDDSLGKCGKLINTLRAMEKHVSETHVVVKKPYLEGGRLVDLEKNGFVGRINVGRQKVQQMMDDYAAEQLKKQRAEQARLAEERRKEEEDRRKLEELARENNLEVALPPPPPPPPPVTARAPIRTDGATVSIGTEWDCRIVDYTKAFRRVKDDAKVREAIDAAIKRLVKTNKGSVEIPGVEQFERAKTSAR